MMWGLLGKAFQVAVLGTGGAVAYSQRDKIGATVSEEFEEAKRDPGQYVSEKTDVVVDAVSNIGETADSVGNAVVDTYDNVSNTARDAKNLADQFTNESEGGFSLMSIAKWVLGGGATLFGLSKLFGGKNDDNDNDGIGFGGIALTMGIAALAYFNWDKIQNGLDKVMGDDSPELETAQTAPRTQTLDDALTM